MQFQDLIHSLPTKRAKRMFKAARVAAMASPGIGRGSYRIGAVLADGGNVLSAGFNSYKSHPRLLELPSLRGRDLRWPHLHAEQHCLFNYGLYNCSGMDLFVCRIWRDNKTIGLSKPCERCQEFISLAGLNCVHYTTYEGVETWKLDQKIA
jgi:deoxycytidylate deaminase